MKNIIILSFLNPWSMGKGKGAPSFYKTIEGYKKNWNVRLIIKSNYKYELENIEGITILTYKSPFTCLLKIKFVSFFARIADSLYGTYQLYKLGGKCIKEIGKNNTIIYAYEVNAVKASKMLSVKYGLPLVTRFQGTILYPIENTLINRLKNYPHFNALETVADIIIMTDDGTHGLETLKRLNNKSSKFYFWQNGVDVGNDYTRDYNQISELKSKLNIKSYDKVLLTISRLTEWKRVDRSIKALKKLIDEGNIHIKLLIIGDGQEKDNLINMVTFLNLSENVIFVGAIEQKEVAMFMDISDVFLSLYDLSNVGNPLLEAMTMGKPIITLNTGATSSIITNGANGILLELEQIDSLPAHIMNLIKDDSYSKSLGDSARKYAEDHFWSWENRITIELKAVNGLLENYRGDK